MKIKTEADYQKSINHRNDLLEAYSFLGVFNADSLDKQISEIDIAIEQYESFLDKD